MTWMQVKRHQGLQATEFKKCSQDPKYFIKNYVKIRHPKRGTIKFDTYGWQDDIVDHIHTGKNVVLLKSRQLGASWIIGAYIVWLITFRLNIEASLFSVRLVT